MISGNGWKNRHSIKAVENKQINPLTIFSQEYTFTRLFARVSGDNPVWQRIFWLRREIRKGKVELIITVVRKVLKSMPFVVVS